MERPFEKPDKPYVVELRIVPFDRPVYKGFDTIEEAEEFADNAKAQGLVLGPLTVLPRGVLGIALHRPDGLTIRPGPAQSGADAEIN
ncbi:MAG: hypothetical protein GTO15_11125 [Pseudomonas stutzeri]|nr:hypothetical protein [Stutzerimonas stutzeri]